MLNLLGGIFSGFLKWFLALFAAEQFGEQRVNKKNLEIQNEKQKAYAKVDESSKDHRRHGRAGLLARLRSKYGISGSLPGAAELHSGSDQSGVAGKPNATGRWDDDDDIF